MFQIGTELQKLSQK